MSTATRAGTHAHRVLEALETARARLARMDLSALQCDRVAVVLAMMLCDRRCSKEDAIGAADRLFPMPNATQPAGELKSPANEPEPTRQA